MVKVGRWSVLLLEAGGAQPVLTDIPGAAPTVRNVATEWRLRAEHDARFCRAMHDQRCAVVAGRVLGGTSTINGMVYVRGNRRDYDHWRDLGNPGWGWEDVLPYFKKSEDMRVKKYRGDKRHHATGGHLSIEEYRFASPLVDHLLKAVQQLGFDISDHNDEDQRGFVRFYGTVRDGLRCNSAKAFLQPVWRRHNLDIALHSRADRVLIDPDTKRAYGVEFTRDYKTHTALADKEVIVSAGTFHSPQLLMLSGVGPREHLEEVGVSPVVADLKVGYNLEDHIALGGNIFLLNRGTSLVLPRYLNPVDLINFLINTQGPAMTGGIAEVFGFFSTNHTSDPEWPDVAVYFESVTDNNDGGVYLKDLSGISDDFFSAVFEPVLYQDAFAALGTLLRPHSRGRVQLRSADPRAPPRIHLNYLADERDVRALVEAAKFARRVADTPAFQRLGARPNPRPFPACANATGDEDAYLECALREYTMSLWHYGGTCKMGPASDPDAVVDARLRVHGLQGLRVADVSITPVVPSGNTNAPAIMIGEKAADMIKEDWGLETR
ncbi:Uncharacterized protein GBIM_07237 [Gryllus bimaculatus]|nr:Uncharacterized protein GBIM_07237 [Gryllus bimaculatus]